MKNHKIFLTTLNLILFVSSSIQFEDTDGEYGEHFQGDMELTPEQEEFMNLEIGSDGHNRRLTGLTNPFYRWPKSHKGWIVDRVVVPLQFSYTFKREFFIVLGSQIEIIWKWENIFILWKSC